MALGIDPPEKNVLTRKPRNPETGIFTRPTLASVLLFGFRCVMTSLSSLRITFSRLTFSPPFFLVWLELHLLRMRFAFTCSITKCQKTRMQSVMLVVLLSLHFGNLFGFFFDIYRYLIMQNNTPNNNKVTNHDKKMVTNSWPFCFIFLSPLPLPLPLSIFFHLSPLPYTTVWCSLFMVS